LAVFFLFPFSSYSFQQQAKVLPTTAYSVRRACPLTGHTLDARMLGVVGFQMRSGVKVLNVFRILAASPTGRRSARNPPLPIMMMMMR